MNESGLAEDLQEGVGEVAKVYGFAMLQGQLLELAAKMAEPALHGPTDTAGSRASAERGRQRSLHAAIAELQDAGLDHADHAAITEALHAARGRRNSLAHDFWWWAFAAVMVGETAKVLEQLEQDKELFERLTQMLFETALKPGVARRGLEVSDFASTVSALAAALIFRPEEFQGLHILDDGEALLEQLQTLLIDSQSANDG